MPHAMWYGVSPFWCLTEVQRHSAICQHAVVCSGLESGHAPAASSDGQCMQGTQRCSASFDSLVRDCTPIECITPASQLKWKTAGRCTACSHLGPSHAATAPGRHAMPAAKSARTCQASGSATHPFSALHALSVHCPTLNARFKQAQARTGSHCCGIASGHSSHSQSLTRHHCTSQACAAS